MTTKLQSLHPNPWYRSLQKRLQSRLLIGLLLLGGIAGTGFSIYRAIAPSQNAQSQMLTVPVEQQSLLITLSANGTVKAERTINLSPKSAGYLKQLLVKEGDRVRQGQVVAYVESPAKRRTSRRNCSSAIASRTTPAGTKSAQSRFSSRRY